LWVAGRGWGRSTRVGNNVKLLQKLPYTASFLARRPDIEMDNGEALELQLSAPVVTNRAAPSAMVENSDTVAGFRIRTTGKRRKRMELRGSVLTGDGDGAPGEV
jgi:hypothetical protein